MLSVKQIIPTIQSNCELFPYNFILRRLQIKMKLYERGVPSDLIEQALEDEYTGEEDRLIDRLLEKKQYDASFS